jgi:hypothetical protein
MLGSRRFELDNEVLTQHERPGAEAKSSTQIGKLFLRVGATITAELDKELSFVTVSRPSADGSVVQIPWSGLAVESQAEYDVWVRALSTRAVTVAKTQAGFGMEYDDDGVITELIPEPDGEPGPAEANQMRVGQRIVSVNGTDITDKVLPSSRSCGAPAIRRVTYPGLPQAGIDAIMKPANVVGGLDEASFVTENVGVEPVSLDDLEDGKTEGELAQRQLEEEETLRREMEDEEAAAARAEEELKARIQVEYEAEKKRLEEEEKRKAEEEKEFQEGFGRLMIISQSLSGKMGVSTAQLLSGNIDRRLYKEGLLSRKKDDSKKADYYFLFSDMICIAKEQTKKGKTTFEIMRVIQAAEIQTAKVTSMMYHADATERSGFHLQVAPEHLARCPVLGPG